MSRFRFRRPSSAARKPKARVSFRRLGFEQLELRKLLSVNQQPTLDAVVGPISVFENSAGLPVTLTGISDGDGDTQTLTITAVSDTPSVVANPLVTYANPNDAGSLTIVPALNATGSATITVTVKDNGGTDSGGVDTIVRTFVVNVLPVNQQPTLDAVAGPISVLQNAGSQTLLLTGIGAGPNEVQQLTVTATSDTHDLIADPTITYTSPNDTATLNFTPLANKSGTATITVTIKDNGGTDNGGDDTFTQTFTIQVTAVNQSPTLDTLASPITVLENAGEQTINLTGITAGPGDTQTLTVTATSNAPGLIPDPIITYSNANSTGTLTFTPTANSSGSAVITVTVKDNGNTLNGGVNTTTQTFTIQVTAVNQQPTLDAIASPLTILENAGTQNISLTGISAGPGDTQTVTITTTSDNPTLIPDPLVTYTSGDATGSLAFSPTANSFGTAVITVTVKDNGGTNNGGSDTLVRKFTVNVTAVNQRPTLDTIDSFTILENALAQNVNLTGISAGPGDSQTVTVTASSDNTGLIADPTVTYTSPNTAGSLAFTPVANKSGEAVITVTVKDNGGTSNGGFDTVVRTFTVHVTAVNQQPTLDAIASPLTILENAGLQTIDLTGIGAGTGDSQTLTVTATSDTTGLIPDPTVHYTSPGGTGSLTFTPVANVSGTAEITVTVKDTGGTANGGVDTITRKFTVQVTAVNQRPTLATLGDILIVKNAGQQTVSLSGISAGPGDTQTLTVTATSSLPGLIPDPTIDYTSAGSTGSLKFTPAANMTGAAVITVTVKDNGGTANGGFDTIARTFTVTVGNPNEAPSFTAGPNQAVAMNAGTRTVSNWATNILPGPLAESGQTISFLVSTDNPSLFSTAPAIDASGKLTYTPATNVSGFATISVRAKDNGGTAGSGVDTSVEQTFTILVSGVSVQGNTLTIEGTLGDDAIDVSFGSAASFSVTFNGTTTSYTVGSGANQVNTILIYGESGNDTLTAADTFNARSAAIHDGGVSITSAGFELTANALTTIKLTGTASSTAAITDSTVGDVADVTANSSSLRGPAGSPFLYQVTGFGTSTITVTAGTGAVGTFHSPVGGIATAQPTIATLQMGTTIVTLTDFSTIYFYSSGSTSDQAYLYGTAVNDSFIGTQTYAYLSGTVNGNSYFNDMVGYHKVRAFGQGGSDVANLYDSKGLDHFVSTTTYAYLYGGSGSTAFYNDVRGFAQVNGRSTRGGGDVATLYDSKGNDKFLSYTTYARMTAAGIQSTVYGFKLATGKASSGTDTAYFYDGKGSNVFSGTGKTAKLARTTDANTGMGTGFDRVIAVQASGKTDRKVVKTVSYTLSFKGVWT